MRDAVEKAAKRTLMKVQLGKPILRRDLDVLESRYRFENTPQAERIGSMPESDVEPASDCPAYREITSRLDALSETVADLTGWRTETEIERFESTKAAAESKSSVSETLEDLIRKAGRHQVAECLKALGGPAVEAPQPHAAVRRALRLVRDVENLGPSQGIDLDERWSAWRGPSPSSPRYLLKKGNLPELTTTHPSDVVLTWIKATGRLP